MLEDHMLASRLKDENLPKRGSPIMDMGEQSTTLHRADTIKKDVPTWGGHDRHHQAQVDYAQDKGLTLIGFWFTCLRVLVRRPSHRLGRIICGEIKPLHSWHHIYWFLFGFSLCEFWSLWSSSWQALVHQKRISCVSHLVFFDVEDLPVLLGQRFHTSI